MEDPEKDDKNNKKPSERAREGSENWEKKHSLKNDKLIWWPTTTNS